jgi:iron complex outermembrane receptor protein
LSLEELMNIEVTSVSKKPQKAWESAAAVFVITQEDIRRSGATSIAEALRMAPGIHVARITASKWAISSRGFNDRFANKLLVLVDGRSVYTPLYSGVYWEVQDTLLEDIERIEVIRGPGATLWGANAVNGVINIITKKAKDTQGTMVIAGAGTEERGFGSVRYGSTLGEDAHYRVYAKYFDRDEYVDAEGDDASDDWDMWRTGFRLDWEKSGSNAITLQGDIYDGESSDVDNSPTPHSSSAKDENAFCGAHILARWDRSFSEVHGFRLQLYWDWSDYDALSTNEVRHTIDVDFNHTFRLGQDHEVVWGLGYRLSHDDLEGSPTGSFDPRSRNDQLFSCFIQDEISFLNDRLHFIFGSKFEHNDYTGFEYQPSSRLIWTPNPLNSLWMAISRAVRTPSRSEQDVTVRFERLTPNHPLNPIFIPIAVEAKGDRDFDSEEVISYEIGYRASLREWLALDIAAFYTDYDNLRTGEVKRPFFERTPRPLQLVVPFVMKNQGEGETYGVELSLECRLRDWWHLQAAYGALEMQLHTQIDRTTLIGKVMAAELEGAEDKAPHHLVSLRSSMDLGEDFEVDLWLRYSDSLPDEDINSFITLDARLGWKPFRGLEIAIVGHNLLDDRHPEFGTDYAVLTPSTEIERGVYGKITWRF